MILLDVCFDLEKEGEYEFGMDAIDGKVDVDANMDMEEHSNRKTIYAIGSEIKENEDESIYLAADDALSEGIVLLKYISDDSDDNFGDFDFPLDLEEIIEEFR